MTIDQYAPCPGGTGKKIKFCCSDLVGELDKIQRMLEGDQRVACLDHVESLQPKYPERACLLSIKAMLESQLDRAPAAAETLQKFREKYPDNPVALAEAAMVTAKKDGATHGIDLLQSALEATQGTMFQPVYDAIGVLGQLLLAEGQILSARAHLVLQTSAQGADHEGALQLLQGLNDSPSVPLLLKQPLPLVSAPADALWKSSFDAAIELAARGAWRAAARKLEELAAKAGDWPAIWQSIATMRAWLADTPGLILALRKFAAQNVPLDDAVEAEALAQIVDPAAADEIDVVTLLYDIADFEKLVALLAASKQTQRIDIDLSRLGSENEPPPKAAYWLLDRPVPATGVDILRADIPLVVGQAFVFGKQTDREARLELVTYRTEEIEAAKRALGEVLGDALGAYRSEETTTQIPALQHVLSWNWRLPDDTPQEHRVRLLEDARHEALLERWPSLKQKIFADRSARDVANDPAYRIPLLAAVLRLELSTEPRAVEFDYNQLRRALGLPTAEPIDPWKVPLDAVPLVRMARLDVMKLSDDDLRNGYVRADYYRHTRALKKLSEEIIKRASIDPQERAAAHGTLAELEIDTALALVHIEQARKLALDAKKSCGPWDMAELTLRMARGEETEFGRLLDHLRTQHMREPGIAQALYQLLAQIGAINPDGSPAVPGGPPAPGGLATPAPTAAPAQSSIWTPGSEPAAAGKKSALWTPD